MKFLLLVLLFFVVVVVLFFCFLFFVVVIAVVVVVCLFLFFFLFFFFSPLFLLLLGFVVVVVVVDFGLFSALNSTHTVRGEKLFKSHARQMLSNLCVYVPILIKVLTSDRFQSQYPGPGAFGH